MVPSVVASCIVCTAVGALSWNLIRRLPPDFGLQDKNAWRNHALGHAKLQRQACQQEQRVPGIGWVSLKT